MRFNVIGLTVAILLGPFAASFMEFGAERDIARKAIVLAILCAVATTSYCAFEFLLGNRQAKWNWPSIREKAYFSGQPVQRFFLGACAFLAMAIGCIVGAAWMETGYAGLFFSTIGVGSMIGVYVSTVLFRSKMQVKGSKEVGS